MIGMLSNRYMLVQPLGEGGMADVFLAIDTLLNREVAVKILRGDLSGDAVALLRFQREANAASALSHPNIVEIYDVGEENGKHYIIMEYVRGRTLKQLVQQRGAMDKNEALSVMEQLVSAVGVAHKNNIIHRDIKPQNVLVKDDGTVKITDFGIATAKDAVQLTQTDTVMGSVHYLAPELARGEVASMQSDIYSLGIVFYELLTGNVPHTGEAAVQIAIKHMREDIPSVREFNATIPQSIDNIVIKATVKSKANRYLNCDELLEDLKHCLDENHLNDEVLVFSENKENGDTILLPEMSAVRERKKPSLAYTIIGLGLTIVAGVIFVMVMVLGNMFEPVNRIVTIPDVTGMNLDDAKTELNAVMISVSSVRYQLTDNIPEGQIISISPQSGTEIEKGSTVILTISEGIYFTVGDYTNQNIEDVRTLLANTKLTIRVENEPSSIFKPGTIIRQELQTPGTKLDPQRQYEIKFIVASDLEIFIPQVINVEINTAKATLEALGAKVTLTKLYTEGLTAEQYAALIFDVVVQVTPNVGSLYIQGETNTITLSYYAS
ncbi:MAG: Stk1 family PASTA domain-containing Ser/Thr kinase [Erysipelotrichales bacterium]|nr:MAG: Stk1 family PASTA domain-containing Ser/Thr kinase [Erysipelotrichales bacterium]